MMTNQCKAKNPLTCPYHGISEYSGLDKAGAEVLEALNSSRTFLLNRKQRKENLLKAYSMEDFLKPEQYSKYVTFDETKGNPKPGKFFTAESEWQDSYLKNSNSPETYKQMKLAVWKMIMGDSLNIKIRDGQELDNAEKSTVRMLDRIYGTLPERGIMNRLFRGVSFSSETEFKNWLKNNSTTGEDMLAVNEYIRTSVYARVAHSFSQKRPYSVIFEYITKGGLYTEKFSPAPQEAEVLFNKEKKFKLSGTYTTEIYNPELRQKQTLRIVNLTDA